MEHLWVWIGFNLAVLAVLAIDLGVFHRTAHEISVREAAGWTATWVTLSLLFNLGIDHCMGPRAGLEFLTGYLIEQALSVDNIFVFVLDLLVFLGPGPYQHRVLFWGILGALMLRGTMIGTGSYLINRFHWVIYVFGALPRLHRHPHGDGGRSGHRGRREPDAEAGPPSAADQQPLSRAALLRARTIGNRRPRGWSRRRCSWCWCWSRRPISSSPSTRFRRSSPSRPIRFSSTPRTCARSSACDRCISCSPASSTSSAFCRSAWRSCWCSSARRC